MALAQKPRKTAATRKSQAEHHQHSKHYLKAYHPFLPIAGIVALGAVANSQLANTSLLGAHQAYVPTTATPNLSAAIEAAQPVSRIAVITGDTTGWVTLIVAVIAVLALATLLLRHSYRVHRALNRGEAFVVHHPLIDIVGALIVTAGFVLTRTSSVIR